MATGSDTRRGRIENTDNFIEQSEQFVNTEQKICKDLQNKFVVDDLKCKLVESKIQFVREKESLKTKENS